MKYSEFKAEVEKLGLHLGVYEFHIDVVDKNGDTVSCIAKDVEMNIDTDYGDFQRLPKEQRVAVFESLYKLAKTPLAEREEEKRYYLRFIHPNILGEREPFYLHLHHSESAKDYYEIGTVKAPFGNKLQTIFTESEIAEMDITGFEKEPVKLEFLNN